MSKSESKSSPSFDPSPLPLPAGEYEVFLSFRGPDVRQTFADHLYTYLVASKIHTFRDEEELPKGEFLAPALEKAITESKAYIPIFSQNYASSKWCLQELANIVKCWKSGGGAKAQHVIFPVFYFIDPRDVRHPDSGSYKEAFEQHSLKNDPKTVLEWKNALQEVGKMKGWHITESDGQGAIIDKIFSKVDIHLRANYTLVTDELVGIDSHVENVVKLLNLDSASEKIVGIHGMGGLGKTTLAKAVYNKVSTQFEGCCFLDNIRDALSEKDGVLALQNKIISGILRKDSFKAKDVNDGIRVIKHAFGVNYPPEDYASLSTEFVRVATGLPLYLKVIGSLLFKRDKSFWKDKLIELKQIPPTEVQERLRISYNDLTHNQKQIFLDIACLFTEVYKEGPMHMWRDCDFHPTSAINTLVQRSLVKIGNDDAIWMHDHVRDLGRAIVREEHNQSPFKRSRMSYSKDAIDMLKYKEGTDSVEALRVDMKGENLVLRNEHLKELSRLRYLLLWNARLSGNFKDVLPNIRWLGLTNCDSVPSDLNVKKLVVLQLQDCSVSDGWKGWNEIKVSRKLKIIRLIRCLNLNTVPDLSNCKDLEHLDFMGCRNMRGELDITNLKNLKLLRVSDTKITKLKGEIEKLQNLQELDASNSSLIEVLAGISKLPSLERLNLGITPPNKLEMTEMFPNSLTRLFISSSSLPILPSSLTRLQICYCEHLPNLANLTNLLALHLSDVSICVLLGLGELKLLEALNIERAPNLVNLDGLESLVLLKQFSLEQFPDLSNLKNLRELWITECNKLIEVTGLDTLESLELLSMYGSGSIKKLPDLSRLVKLKKLYVTGCTKLIEIRGLEKLELLEDLDMSSCKSIKELPNLSGLKILNKLVLRKCRQLKEVKGIEDLEFLQVFEADKRLEFKYLLKRVSRYGKHFVTRSVPGALCMGN
ncbi:Disease resistance protein L6 [Linum perenne]